MSYDLHFYKHKEHQVNEQEIADYLTNKLHLDYDEEARQWAYFNDETEASFWIEWVDTYIEGEEIDDDEEEIDEIEEFENYDNLNFIFSINYFRADYFGLEIFPMIEKMADELSLFISNPQDRGNDLPRVFKEGELFEAWKKSNHEVTKNYFKEYGFEYISPEKSNYIWQYLSHRDELQAKLGSEVFACGCFFIKDNENGNILTAAVWTEHIPVVLPRVDLVIVQKRYKKMFKHIDVSGLVKYSQIIGAFGNQFKNLEHPVPHLKIINQKDADSIEKEFNNLEIWKKIEEFGTGVSKSDIVNVKPQ